MNRALIENDSEAKAIAEVYGVAESMMAEMERRLPDSIAAGTGLVIGCKRAAPVPAKDIVNWEGPFEFVFIAYFAGFIEGENGWTVIRWWNVTWDDLPTVMLQIDQVEKEMLPKAVSEATAKPKFEQYMKDAAMRAPPPPTPEPPPNNLTGQG